MRICICQRGHMKAGKTMSDFPPYSNFLKMNMTPLKPLIW